MYIYIYIYCRYHSELAIYPIGYMSNRVCFAPGEIQTKSGMPCRRAVYKVNG